MDSKKKRAVAWWLLAGVVMIVVEFIMGGVTRLTDSGLSITEWKPIMGTLPPLSNKEWNKAFDGYKHIAQYKYLNNDFTLHDFKFIFFWEWSHRLWARMLFVVFAIGFTYFLVKKYFDRQMIRPLIVLVLLGGLQGLIGWKMVQSGLNETDLYVKHTWLAVHFVSAMVLVCFTLWYALQLLIPAEKRVVNKKLNAFTIAIILLVFLQLAYGAFMAGLHAGKAAPTWPTINGMWIPDNMMQKSLIYDVLNVQFIHRGIAYLLLILLFIWFGAAARNSGNHTSDAVRKAKWWPLGIVLLQVTLGIVTVLSAPMIVQGKFGIYETLAEVHQLTGMSLLMSLVVNLYLVKRK